ncbi:MAG: hormogonium polysaccharide biosynthesis glycosyltransferase HpsP [Elainella sp.]
MNTLSVLQIVPSVSLVYGGPSQMALGLSKSLAAQGVNVTIVTTNANGDSGQQPLDVPLNQALEQDGYQIRYFNCSPFRRYKFSLDLLKWLSQNADRYDVAHIHALFSPVSSSSAAIARARQLPYILRPLGTLDPADLQKKKQLKRLYAQFLEAPNLKGAAAVHFTSDQEAKISERFGAVTRDWVIPLGVELPEAGPTDLRAQLNLPTDRPLVLFMSRIDPKKGLDLLLPALEDLLAELPFHLMVAGANPQEPQYEAQIRQQIQTSGLAAHTTWMGFVTGALKTQLLQAADLFVLPSYYENFGIAVAEAMLAGLPVVVSDQVHIWPQIAQAEAGWICRCDRADLTQQLRIALTHPEQRQQRGQNAHRYAREHYSWEAIAQQMIRAYGTIARS